MTAAVLALVCPSLTSAQPTPGSRAAGMADAFTAVADDASAVYWNPSGLVMGPLFNFQIDHDRLGPPDDLTLGDRAAVRQSASLVALGIPPLGLSYYRLSTVEVGSPDTVEPGTPGRQLGGRPLRALTTHHVGVTVLQSIGEWLTVGATPKLVIGAAARGELASAGEADGALGAAEALDRDRSVRGDVDAGAMVEVGAFRAGITGRNLTAPRFGGDGTPEDERLQLRREARVGVAWGSQWPERSRLVVAADADVVRRRTATTDRRDVAVGAETWWADARVGLRTGVRASTIGEARPVVTAGASVGLLASVFLDGHAAWGDDERGWGIGARFVF